MIILFQFLPNWNCRKNSPKKFHRRSSSYPVNLRSVKQEIAYKKMELACQKCSSALSSSIFHDSAYSKKVLLAEKQESTKEEMEKSIRSRTLLRTWRSFPELNKKYGCLEGRSTSTETVAFKKPERRMTADSRKIELSSVIKVDYSEVKDIFLSPGSKSPKLKSFSRKGRSKKKVAENSHVPKKYSSGSSDTLNCEDYMKAAANERPASSTQSSMESSVTDSAKVEMPISVKRKFSFFAGSAPEFSIPWSLEVEGQKDIRIPKKSFMEDGGSSVQPMAIGYFPRPLKGQSIMSFLSSAQSLRANAELDRENAHFSISEAMIAAIEQVN